jgi:hypothetical protein
MTEQRDVVTPATAVSNTPKPVDFAGMKELIDRLTPPPLYGLYGDRWHADLRWVEQQLARFTYKPGWTFSARSNGMNGGIAVTVIMRVEDTYNLGQMVDVKGQLLLTPFTFEPFDEERFARRLADFLKDMEIHESREWLKRDGKIYDNPHA